MALFINEFNTEWFNLEIAGGPLGAEVPLLQVEAYEEMIGELVLEPFGIFTVGGDSLTYFSINGVVDTGLNLPATTRAVALIDGTTGIVLDFVDFGETEVTNPTSGSAAGMTPEKVVASGTGASFAKVGTGLAKTDFTWERQGTTIGAVNTGQVIGEVTEPTPEEPEVPTTITPEAVIEWSGLSALNPEEQSALNQVVVATNVYVDSLPSIDRKNDGTWKETTKLGALMLASRLYRRKNSPGGIEAVGEMTTYVSRYDSDIARLLHIDNFRKPQVG